MPQSPPKQPPVSESKGGASRSVDNESASPSESEPGSDPQPQVEHSARRATRSATKAGTPSQPPPQPPKPRRRKRPPRQPVNPQSTPPPPPTSTAQHIPSDTASPHPESTPPKVANKKSTTKKLNPHNNNTPKRTVDHLNTVGATPPTKKASTTMSFAQNVPIKELHREAAREEVTGHIIGPMPPQEFLDEFLSVRDPQKSDKVPEIDPDVFQTLAESKRENDMYQSWIDALEPYCGKNVVQVDSHANYIFDQDGIRFGPDITAYVGVEAKRRKEKCTLTEAELLIECKFSSGDDPFEDDDPAFESKTIGGKETLGQITVYATAQLARQFRTHVFSILVFPTYARLLRWDRSGATLTGKIDLLDTEIIPEFFLRLQRATKAQRGVDETVKLAKLTLAQKKEVITALNATDDAVLLEVMVGDRKFITANSVFFGASSPLGRATRCYRAYDLKTKECFILKDTWRIYTPLRKPEHQIYRKLRRKGVKHIPKVEIGRDVDTTGHSHQTKTQEYTKASWWKTKRTLRTFRHYRIVLEALSGHLSSCRNMRDVVVAIRDVAEAEAQAADEACVDHRDTSYSNIMVKYVDGEVEGFLIDWDMSLETDVDYGEGDSAPERTGTWYFIAARLILPNVNPPPVQNRIDDVESLFHVLLYMALHYSEHDLASTDTTTFGSFITDYFLKAAIEPDGRYSGGDAKASFFREEGHEMLRKLKCTPLMALFVDLIPPLAARYTQRRQRNVKTKKGRVPRLEPLPAKHGKMLKKLEDSYWFMETLNQHLNDATSLWTKGGGIVPQRIRTPPTTRAINALSHIPARSLMHPSLSLQKIHSDIAQKRKAEEELRKEEEHPKTSSGPITRSKRKKLSG